MIAFLYSLWLIRYIEVRGKKRIGASPLHLFRGFLHVILEHNNQIFEEYLEKLGTEKLLHIVTIGFRSKIDKQIKCVIIIPNFHPGPFLNVGSSNLPYLIQNSIESESGVFTAVPHGISGHDMNLVSQNQNNIVIEEIKKLITFKTFKSTASPFVSIQQDYAKSNCQIFGDCPFVTLTLAPRDMEDIPTEIGAEIMQYVKNRKFKHAALVDAHNSISKVTILSDEDLKYLVQSAKDSIREASSKIEKNFKLGIAKIDLSEYLPSQGVGPGGGRILVFKVSNQISAYLIFDANNMKTGVRETIQNHLKNKGFHVSEVMTTDTHSVNGLISAKLGYHPFGEILDIKKLLNKIEDGIKEAINNLETCDTSSNYKGFPVKILGLKLYKELTSFIYQTSKLVALSLFPLLIFTIFIFLTYLSI
jgi:putative membrane protein